jgi:hypothetical protein
MVLIRLTSLSCASLSPSSRCRVPLRSESVITRAPNPISRSAACNATFPAPETRQRFPSSDSPRVASISSAK